MSALSADISRRNLLIGGALLGTAAVAAAIEPSSHVARQTDKSFEALFPLKIGSWTYIAASGLVLPPSDELSRELYEQLLTRVYQADDGTQIMLLLAYSSIQEGRLQVHRPEVCYPAAGYTLIGNRVHEIGIGPQFALPTRFITAERNLRRESLIYWTRVGPSLPTRWFDQRLIMATENLKGNIPDGILARISTTIPDTELAMQVLDGFTRQFIKALGPQARSLLVGAN